jgi:hypothetical protein
LMLARRPAARREPLKEAVGQQRGRLGRWRVRFGAARNRAKPSGRSSRALSAPRFRGDASPAPSWGLPAIPRLWCCDDCKTWMPGTSPGMTS